MVRIIDLKVSNILLFEKKYLLPLVYEPFCSISTCKIAICYSGVGTYISPGWFLFVHS